MKASVNVANAQPSATAAGLNVGQGLQLSNKEVIVRIANAVWLQIASNGTFVVETNVNSLTTSPGFLLPASSAVSITL